MTTTFTVDKSFAYIDRLTKHGSVFAACAGIYNRVILATRGASTVNITGVSDQLTAQPLDIVSNGTPSAYYVLTPKGITTLSTATNPVITAESVFDTGSNRWLFYSGGNLIAPTAFGGVRLQTIGGTVLTLLSGIVSECTTAAFANGVLYVFDGKRGKMAVVTVTATVLVYEGTFDAPNCRDILRAVIDGTDLYCLNRNRVVRFSIATGTSPTLAQDYGKMAVEFTDVAVTATGKLWFGFATSTPALTGPEFFGPLYGVWDVTNQEVQTAAPKMSAWMLHNVTPYYTSVTIPTIPAPPPVVIPTGRVWTSRATPVDNSWSAVAYGNGVFAAVAFSGTGNRAMSSPDGVTWTIRASAADNDWVGICYGAGLFVAVAFQGSGNRVMTSPDGVTWTLRTTVGARWRNVCYGGGQFVAVAEDNGGQQVMTSPDGITWTMRSTPANNLWYAVTYGGGVYVAVAASGTGNRVMTSPDGITWTSRASAADNSWHAICYGNGLFVAVGFTGVGNRIMTSPDGITWTTRTNTTDNGWLGVAFSGSQYTAVAVSGPSAQRVMLSLDGITWTDWPAPTESWRSLCYGNNTYVAVAYTGTGFRAMTSNG